ncbi:M20/M25/M40 family metallo-hydrolase [Peribacillus frigoritolerans]|nr:M20/M25/M40 family metallo-hydrolase [Peribacillus frigoritolerans]
MAKIYGATININYQRGYPAVVNHDREVDFMVDVAREVFGVENTRTMKPNMVGEDFSYYLKEIPGAFCFVGAGIRTNLCIRITIPAFRLMKVCCLLPQNGFIS